MATVTLKGNPFHTNGDLPTTGSKAPAFNLVKTDLSEVSASSLSGKRIVLNIFPSVDTPTCAQSVRTFNSQASSLNNTVVVCASQDLPFALARFCGAEGLNNVIPASAFRSSFGADYGVKLVDGPLAGLTARAVVVLDTDGKVLHTELVSEVANEPNYDAALKVIEDARHIEIQVMADDHGNVIHLFERDCSVQRRNQKVVEEAPSPFISAATRERMGEIAKKAAREIGYTNAGTIEFLVDNDENFYFLEMNTRIQVEHAITEEITKQDIVRMQIEVAQGEELTVQQEDLAINGHAIEMRIYAEDPIRFFPSPGTITTYQAPSGEHIRLESGIEEGTKITPFYDPMISKLVVWGATREEAMTQSLHALEDYQIEGIKTNLPMLKEVIQHPAFQKGEVTTDFVSEHYLPLVQKSK